MSYLGIEIGGTKLQLGVGTGDSASLQAERRAVVDAAAAAAGILRQIEQLGHELLAPHPAVAIGVGFGGPVSTPSGVIAKSHQIAGWDGFPLRDWLQTKFGLPAVVENDCNVAALAEAQWGAGRGLARVFYVTVGTGVGGGFVVDGQIDGRGRPACAEIGHLRPGLAASDPNATVESLASGWGIARHAQLLLGELSQANPARELRAFLDEQRPLQQQPPGSGLTAKEIAAAAAAGNALAKQVLTQATQTLGWAIAQVITLLAPHRVVIGGGISLMPPELFLEPVRRAAERFVFPPLRNSFEIVPAELGESVVLHGAIAVARQRNLERG
jgi:glucokinase